MIMSAFEFEIAMPSDTSLSGHFFKVATQSLF